MTSLLNRLEPGPLRRYSLRILIASALVSLAGGVLYALWPRQLASIAILFSAIPMLGFLVAIVLGMPALFLAGSAFRRRDHRKGGRNLLLFFGPVFVLVGMEVVPHILSPCVLSENLQREVCERTSYNQGFGGRGEVIEDVDVKDRFHLLQHSLMGAVPMTAAYALALRRPRSTSEEGR